MPSPQEILGGLETIANGWITIAVLWHLALAVALTSLTLGWRPERRLAGLLLALPSVSVSLLAWRSGNPFNGATFIVLAATLATLAVRLPRGPVESGAPGFAALGLPLIAFGWIYPHFLQADSWVSYLYASPLGLIPCPTLSIVIGMTLLGRGFGSGAFSLTLAGAGALYGLIGWLRLGVVIDVVLLTGALALALQAIWPSIKTRACP